MAATVTIAVYDWCLVNIVGLFRQVQGTCNGHLLSHTSPKKKVNKNSHRKCHFVIIIWSESSHRAMITLINDQVYQN